VGGAQQYTGEKEFPRHNITVPTKTTLTNHVTRGPRNANSAEKKFDQQIQTDRNSLKEKTPTKPYRSNHSLGFQHHS